MLFKFDVFTSFEQMKLASPALSQQAFLKMLEHRSLCTGRVRTVFIWNIFEFLTSNTFINQNNTILLSRRVVFVVIPSTESFESLPFAVLRKRICAWWNPLNAQHAHQTCWLYLQMVIENITGSRSPKGQWNLFIYIIKIMVIYHIKWGEYNVYDYAILLSINSYLTGQMNHLFLMDYSSHKMPKYLPLLTKSEARWLV